MADRTIALRMGHVTCYKCGITFAIPSDFARSRKKDGKSFYCPNGHPQKYIPREKEADCITISDSRVTMWPEGASQPISTSLGRRIRDRG
jgi:hypothetical protein